MPNTPGGPELPDLTGLSAEELRTAVQKYVADYPGDPTELLSAIFRAAPPVDAFARPTPVNRRHARRDEPVTYRIKVELLDSSPPIWRRLDITSDMPLPRLHLVIQEAMGWWNCHLHEFIHSGSRRDPEAERFESYDHPDAGENGSLDEADVRVDELLHAPGEKILYWYDFGDDWMHRITLEQVLPRERDAPAAHLVTGRRACPPEDCGGIHHYNDLVSGEVPWEPEEKAAYGDMDPEGFDVDEARARVTETLDAPASLREIRLAEADNLLLLLRHLGDGVTLTQAGYLPPRSVRQLMAQTGWDRLWIGACNREDWTYPITELREWARLLGLTRTYRGELRPTRLGTSMLGDRDGVASLIDRTFPFDHLYGTPLDRF